MEDSDDDYEATVRAFGKANKSATFFRCEDGQEALVFMTGEGRFTEEAPRPSIILLDLSLPGFDGRKFLTAIRNIPRLASIPVVILSTSDDERDIEFCYANGANGYVKKPLDIDDFIEAVRRPYDYWFGTAILPKWADARRLSSAFQDNFHPTDGTTADTIVVPMNF